MKLDQFYDPPFNLPLGERISVRGSAVNSRGIGKHSLVNIQGPRVVIKPKIAGPPKLLGASWTSIALAWDKVMGKNTGGTDIESYYLEW